ncbi:hypothetical protein N0V90_008998 [Kalmusia sp. IMI 367209]|nr:hypothetical protein N0V90_008998 [Kalmusia sp. IMI 367209]
MPESDFESLESFEKGQKRFRTGAFPFRRWSRGDTTLFIATAASYASDGPTLPIIGGLSEHADSITKAQSREKTNSSTPVENKKTSTGVLAITKAPKFDSGPLYKPWTLLPPKLSKQIGRRLSHNHFWEENCIPIVFTKNQNIKSGINKIKAVLESEPGLDAAHVIHEKPKNQDTLIAVSAQGVGTTKLVGIIEMVKRLATSAKNDSPGQTWYMYTSLTSLALHQWQAKRIGNSTTSQDVQEKTARGQQNEDSNKITGNEHKTSEKEANITNIPVLTVWMSLKSIPEFKTAFGEQTCDVR